MKFNLQTDTTDVEVKVEIDFELLTYLILIFLSIYAIAWMVWEIL